MRRFPDVGRPECCRICPLQDQERQLIRRRRPACGAALAAVLGRAARGITGIAGIATA
jgi:hypothetical protein